MAQEENTFFQDVFTIASPVELIKLLSWCISSVVPSSYISEVLVASVWLSKTAPATTAVPEPEESTTPGPSSSPACLSETPHPIISLFPDLPFMCTAPVGCPFAEFLAISTQKKWGCSSRSSLDQHCSKRTCVDSQEVKARSDHSSTWGDDNMPELVPEAGPSS